MPKERTKHFKLAHPHHLRAFVKEMEDQAHIDRFLEIIQRQLASIKEQLNENTRNPTRSS
jgi:hypothetical protein